MGENAGEQLLPHIVADRVAAFRTEGATKDTRRDKSLIALYYWEQTTYQRENIQC